MKQSISDILPSDDELITAIRSHFNAMVKDSTGEYVHFLELDELHKVVLTFQRSEAHTA